MLKGWERPKNIVIESFFLVGLKDGIGKLYHINGVPYILTGIDTRISPDNPDITVIIYTFTDNEVLND